MRLYFVIEPIGIDPHYVDQIISIITDSHYIIPLPGFTDSSTLHSIGIQTATPIYYTQYMSYMPWCIVYKRESIVYHDTNKHIWPILNPQANVSLVTNGSIYIYKEYLKSIEMYNAHNTEQIELVPIFINVAPNSRLLRFVNHYGVSGVADKTMTGNSIVHANIELFHKEDELLNSIFNDSVFEISCWPESPNDSAIITGARDRIYKLIHCYEIDFREPIDTKNLIRINNQIERMVNDD